MTAWNFRKLTSAIALWITLWAVVAAACMLVGSTTGPLTRQQWLYRLEMVLVPSLVGAALAAAGVTFQAVLRNPLADPYLLGASSGAALATYIWSLLLGTVGAVAAQIGQQAFAFAGAAAAIAIVLGLAQRRGRLDPVTLILVGVILNAVCGSVYLLIFSLNLPWDQTQQTGGAFRMLIGGIQTNLTTTQEFAAAIAIAVAWIVLLCVAGQLNVAMLSDAEAQSLGVRVHRLRWIAMIAASLTTAAAVAISGPIGFIGLICPHAARLVTGPDPRRLLPAATALGASLLVVAEAMSRLFSQQTLLGSHLPVGVLTGLLGGPFFLILLFRQKRQN